MSRLTRTRGTLSVAQPAALTRICEDGKEGLQVGKHRQLVHVHEREHFGIVCYQQRLVHAAHGLGWRGVWAVVSVGGRQGKDGCIHELARRGQEERCGRHP